MLIFVKTCGKEISNSFMATITIYLLRCWVLTAVNIPILAFWVVMPSGRVGKYQLSEEHYVSPEDGGSMFLRNVGIFLEVHTVLQPRRSILISACYRTNNKIKF
jgi:hypothetical protein